MAKIIKDENENYIDPDYVEDDVKPSRSNWLIPLLLVPIFFVLGWVSNDFARTNPSVQDEQQYGIGAGPDNQLIPTITPATWMPSDVQEISPVPTIEGNSGANPAF